jgi:hypothetical protein
LSDSYSPPVFQAAGFDGQSLELLHDVVGSSPCLTERLELGRASSARAARLSSRASRRREVQSLRAAFKNGANGDTEDPRYSR